MKEDVKLAKSIHLREVRLEQSSLSSIKLKDTEKVLMNFSSILNRVNMEFFFQILIPEMKKEL